MTYTVSITSQGQFTIPIDIRRALGLQKASKATVLTDGGKMVVEPIKDIFELRGVVKTKKRIPFRTIRNAFGDYMARRST